MTTKLSNTALTPFVNKGKIRVVLSWPDAPRDLDLYSIFVVDPKRYTKCWVFFGKSRCAKTRIDVDNNLGGRKGGESITIDVLEKYIYTFAVKKFVTVSKGNLAKDEKMIQDAPVDETGPVSEEEKLAILIPDIPLSQSRAKVAIFINGFKNAIQEIFVPTETPENYLLDKDKYSVNHDWWLAFCLNGNQGLESLKIVNKLSTSAPSETYCEGVYNKNKSGINKDPDRLDFVQLTTNNFIRKMRNF